MAKAKELRELDLSDLDQRLEDTRKELFNLRFQLATGRLDNVSRIGVLRKEIARLITVLAERGAGPAHERAGITGRQVREVAP